MTEFMEDRRKLLNDFLDAFSLGDTEGHAVGE